MKKIVELLEKSSFSSAAVCVIDFQSKSLASTLKGDLDLFDLASMTKVFTAGVAYLDSPKLFNDELLFLLEHRSGIPSWARLSKREWSTLIDSYHIKESDTLYSDLGMIRLSREFDKISQKSLYEISSKYWDKDIIHWTQLKDHSRSPVTGIRNKLNIKGVVHDDNAFIIGGKLPHAGLFGTADAVAQSILNIDEKLNLINSMSTAFDERKNGYRFIKGWDTVENLETTLAGPGASTYTFGHLGFTGTCVWIDAVKKKGFVLLTNATEKYWYNKAELNQLRRNVGKIIWDM